jgi:phosphoesterase RecJ-like protein
MALGGGGHTLAAGYSSYLDREKTIEALRRELCDPSASGRPPQPGAVPDGR